MTPSDMATSDDEQIEEERRLLYVAMNRASRNCTFIFPCANIATATDEATPIRMRSYPDSSPTMLWRSATAPSPPAQKSWRILRRSQESPLEKARPKPSTTCFPPFWGNSSLSAPPEMRNFDPLFRPKVIAPSCVSL
jgi:ATP-dependent exoDNAse (exonuclease V) beta subunit